MSLAVYLCPIVRRIWTPSWTLARGGVRFLFTALFFEILDLRQKRAWAFLLLVQGMNSIAAYCPYEAFEKSLVAALLRHFTRTPFQILGPAFEACLLESALWR